MAVPATIRARDREPTDTTRPVAPRPHAGRTARVLDLLHSARFVDRPLAQMYATLLDEDTYLCSPRTMYRLLRRSHEVRERRPQRTHPPRAIPHLCATGPIQVWTWDVTDLKGPGKGDKYKLYVVVDLYSPYVIAWMLAPRETARLAQKMIRTACRRQKIPKGQLTTHSDRGAIQTAHDWHALFEHLGLTASLSRPRKSNDNPQSEAHFKTTKYASTYPGRFASLRHAKQWCTTFFQFYNHEHRHSSIAYLTPAVVHAGQAADPLAKRHVTMHHAGQLHPERFVLGASKLPILPTHVYINPPEDHAATLVAL